MTILETFIKLRDDLKLWVTNNLNQKANISYVDEKFAAIPEFDPSDIVSEIDTINTHIGEVETDISDYKIEVSEQFTEFDTTIDNYVTVLDGKADLGHVHDANNITSGTLYVEYGGTGYNSIVDTTYTTARYRASALVSAEATPIDNGIINWVYE